MELSKDRQERNSRINWINGSRKNCNSSLDSGNPLAFRECKPLWKIEGEALFKGIDLLKLPEEKMKEIRGTEISFIPQNHIPSIHPLDIIGYQTGEAVEAHENIQRSKITKMVENYLEKLELSDAQKVLLPFSRSNQWGRGTAHMHSD